MISFPFDKFSGTEQLDHMVTFMLRVLKDCHMVFHNGCTSLQCIRVAFPLHPCQNFTFFKILADAHLKRGEMKLINVFICISMMHRDPEHLSVCLLTICHSSLKSSPFLTGIVCFVAGFLALLT